MGKNNKAELKNPWYPLFVTNFLSVFNDNLIKWLVIFIGVSWTAKENSTIVISIANALLVLPFIIFSPYAGRLSRMYSKRKIMIIGKIAEIPIVLVAILGFYFQNFPIVMASILGMGLQSSLFSPSKYGLVREIRGNEGISFGTGMMEMLAFVGVLLGTVVAGKISDYYTLELLAMVALTIAILGVGSAILIKANELPVEERPNDKINPISFLKTEYKFAKKIKGLNYAIMGSAIFWLLGSLITMNLKLHCDTQYRMDNSQTAFITALAAIGIAAGSIMVGLISNKKVRLGYTIIGTFGLAFSLLPIVLFNPNQNIFMVLIFMASFFAGMFKIPLNSFIQANVEGRKLGDVLAYQNIAEFTLISLSAGIFSLVTLLSGNSSIAVFAVTAFITFATAFYFLFKVPGIKDDLKRIIKME